MLVKEVKREIRKCTGREACYIQTKYGKRRLGVVRHDERAVCVKFEKGKNCITVLDLRHILKFLDKYSSVLILEIGLDALNAKLISVVVLKDCSVTFCSKERFPELKEEKEVEEYEEIT